MSQLNLLAPMLKKTVELLANDKSITEIASELHVKPKTIINNLTKARLKMGVKSNHALIIMFKGGK